MFYKPSAGGMWDPTVLYFKGKYYMLCMHLNPENEKWDGMWAAVSEDGVHWEDVGRVLTEDVHVCKMFAYICGDVCRINHGSFSGRPNTDNDTLRFFESSDMEHWEHMFDNHPDSQWYNPVGRWDHMYVIPKDDDQPDKGYWGYVVATPHRERECAFGMLESEDGVHWNILPPPKIEWGDMPKVGMLEVGGCEKIGNTYYFIGGVGGYAKNCGYSLYTFISDSPTGPFRPDKEAFRLCGFDRLPSRVFTQNLAAFCRGKDGELLISNAFDAGFPTKIWLLPNRKAVVDEKGHLRLGYWKQNDLAKGDQADLNLTLIEPVYMEDRSLDKEGNSTDLTPPQLNIRKTDELYMSTSGMTTGFHLEDVQALAVLNQPLDFEKGIILEGELSANKNPADKETEAWPMCWRPATVGFYLEHEDGTSGTAITLEIDHPYRRKSYVEILTMNEKLTREIIDVTDEGCATLAGIDPEISHPFKLFIRRDIFELYVDNLLVQSFIVMNRPSGRIGFVLLNAECQFDQLKLFEMNL